MSLGKHIVATVDDDQRVRESIQSVVESAGYEVLAFASAEEFLRSGTLRTAACLIADVRMPGIDGIELQRRVRAERPHLSVIFITAHDDDGIRRQAMGGGAVEFMVKPFDAAVLLRTIAQALHEP
jgi:FixJ family two-component response regulator